MADGPFDDSRERTGARREPLIQFPPEEVRDDWIPKDDYVSSEFAELERRHLWPRTWQVACRVEELPKVGSFVTYEVLDESIIVVRTSESEIRAYNNACLHRGRRLTDGAGRTQGFVCRFHGWAWNLQGQNTRVVDPEDWGRCMHQKELALREFKIGIWGGFVFVNMDPDCESFEEYLGEMPDYLDPMELDKQRYRWYISVEMEANWKTVQEAFLEAYHVQHTHRRLEPFVDSKSDSFAVGKHGRLQKYLGEAKVGRYSGGAGAKDQRAAFLETLRVNVQEITSISPERDFHAACRIMTELPPTATWTESALKAFEFIREASIASGAGYPNMTREQVLRAGFDWNIFPNTACAIGPTGGIWYRFLPTPDNNPNRSIFEIYSLERVVPGGEPKLQKKHFRSWRDHPDMPVFLIEDFENIADIQRGMRTKHWRAARTNPVQERIISNMHRVLRQFMKDGIEAEAGIERPAAPAALSARDPAVA